MVAGTLSDSTVNLRVTPEILTSKSNEAAQKVNSMRRRMDELRATIDKTKGYWIGEAADLHRQLYYSLEEDTKEILDRLAEHPVDLVAIAQKYSDVELKIQEMVQELPSDVII